MLHSKAFVRKTKKGSVVKVVREHYLRDDLPSGTPLDPACPAEAVVLAADAPRYLVVDTNVALHQPDVLEHAAVTDIVLCSTVLDEARHRDAGAASRLRALAALPAKRVAVFANEHHAAAHVTPVTGESPNDRNDRAVRKVATFYAALVAAAAAAAPPGTPFPVVTLVTDDRACAELATADGVATLTTAALAAALARAAPGLADLVAARAPDAAPSSRAAKRARVYDDHRPMSGVAAGLKTGSLLQGVLRASRFARDEAWVKPASGGDDILIKGRAAINRAFDGDVVAVELLPPSSWTPPSARLPAREANKGAGDENADADDASPAGADAGVALALDADDAGPPADAASAPGAPPPPCAKVVAIVRRSWRARGYAGALLPPRAGERPPADGAPVAALFAPTDRALPLVRVVTRQAATLAGQRIVVAVDGWDAASAHPAGHYVRSLGAAGDKAAETAALLLEHDVATAPFSDAVLACVPRLPWTVTDADRASPGREDWTRVAVLSVDPPGCTDIDDALHVRPLRPDEGADEDGFVHELGVHIADVGHFLHPNTAADAEAASRGTSVYLVGRRIDMLPKALTEDICSLRAGVERLAFSVVWRARADGTVSAPRFFKSVIRSVAALTYAEAQARIDDAGAADGVSVALKTLARLTAAMRARRAAAGALTLASPEVRFELDTETHDPLDVGMYQVRAANQMVEEMMLLANVAAAAASLAAFPGAALLRRHPTPPPRQFAPLLAAAAAAGTPLDATTSRSLANSLDAAVRVGDPVFNRLVRILATRSMTPAQYYAAASVPAPADRAHYGLACGLYTHFTSPIRRYADVVVHRLLAASINAAPTPPSARDPAAHESVATAINVRHRGAQLAARASVELHTLIFFKTRATVADARVVRVRANGVVVFVPKFGIEGPAYFDGAEAGALPPGVDEGGAAAASGDWTLTPDGCAACPPGTDTPAVRVFDVATVRIAVEDGGWGGGRPRLTLTLVPRAELAPGEAAE